MTHTEAFAEHVARATARRAETEATRVTWRRVSADTGGGWSGLGPDSALAFVAPSSGRAGDGMPVVPWGIVRGSERIVIGTAPRASLAKSQAAAFLVANGPTAADEAVNSTEEDKMASKTRSKGKATPKTDEARAQREAKAKATRSTASRKTPKPAEAPTPVETPEGESNAERAPATAPSETVEKLPPPSKAERAEAATGQKLAGPDIAEVLLRTIHERIPGATLESSKGGGKRYVRLAGKTLGYVTLGKRHPSVIVGRSAPVAVRGTDDIAKPVEALAAAS